MPGYQSIRIAGTRSRQASTITALPAMIATMVRGLAAATASISASSRRVERQPFAVAAGREALAAGTAEHLFRERGLLAGAGGGKLAANGES